MLRPEWQFTWASTELLDELMVRFDGKPFNVLIIVVLRRAC